MSEHKCVPGFNAHMDFSRTLWVLAAGVQAPSQNTQPLSQDQ